VEADALLRLPSSKSVQGGVLPEGTLLETIIFSDWRRSGSFTKKNQEVLPPKRSPPPPTPTRPSSSLSSSSRQGNGTSQSSSSSPQSSQIPRSHGDPRSKGSIMLIRVVEDLATYDFSGTMTQARELEKVLGVSTGHKTIPPTELVRVLKSFRERMPHGPLVVIVTSDVHPPVSRRPKTSEAVVATSRVLVPGISQFLHEQSSASDYSFVDCVTGINEQGVVLVDVPLVVQEVNACVMLIWPLLQMAANESHTVCVNEQRSM